MTFGELSVLQVWSSVRRRGRRLELPTESGDGGSLCLPEAFADPTEIRSFEVLLHKERCRELQAGELAGWR